MVCIYDFFDIEYGQHEYNSKSELKVGTVPLISSKGKNQGIYGYFEILPKYKNVISIPRTGSICEAFYQGQDCAIDDNCLVAIPKDTNLSVEEMFYFVALIRKEKYKYMYGRQVTPDRLGETKIPEKFPFWVYKKTKPSFDKLKERENNNRVSLSDRKWKWFEYDKLFDVRKGKRVLIDDIEDNNGEFNFVSAIDSNNGVYCKTKILPNQKRNTITVNYDGSNAVAEAYYQASDFWALDSVNILYPKFELNPYIGMFLVTLIRRERYRYNYGRKWHKERMEKSIIKLPVDSKGNPDWQFMEDYIKSLPYSKALLN